MTCNGGGPDGNGGSPFTLPARQDPGPPGLGDRRAGRGHDAAGWAVVTETTDPTQPRVAFRCCSELETKGTEFYGGTAPLIATKEPPSSTKQPGHRSPPSV